MGLVLLVLGATEIVGAAAGGDYWLRPLESLRMGGGESPAQQHVAFQRVKSVQELERAISLASANDEVTMLDFYADWCVECIRMERNTFPDESVSGILQRFRLLQADVTADDETDQELRKSFGIIGPPAILFFDREGVEMPAYRLVGYFKPEEFSAHLNRVLTAQ